MSMGDEKDKDAEIEPIADVELDDVHGGRRTTPTTGKFADRDMIKGIADGVSNDTLFAGSGDDIKGFNIGVPPYVKKR